MRKGRNQRRRGGTRETQCGDTAPKCGSDQPDRRRGCAGPVCTQACHNSKPARRREATECESEQSKVISLHGGEGESGLIVNSDRT